jgi:hypothetical protein
LSGTSQERGRLLLEIHVRQWPPCLPHCNGATWAVAGLLERRNFTFSWLWKRFQIRNVKYMPIEF